MFLIIYYLATGAVAGTLAGLLGIGGGVVVVPALAEIFLYHSSIPEPLCMKMAIGTSLAIMIITLSAGVFAHHQRNAVNWAMVNALLPGLVAGIILGTVLVHYIPSTYLSIFFSLFLIVIGLRMLFQKSNAAQVETAGTKHFSRPFMLGCSGLIGVLSSLLGAGGGTMWVPFFLYANLKMHHAIGTSVACGIVAAIVATVSFTAYGLFTVEPVPWSTGYIYWPAFAGVAVTSVLFAPLGAALAHRLPTQWLKRIFALFLIFVAMDMIYLTS